MAQAFVTALGLGFGLSLGLGVGVGLWLVLDLDLSFGLERVFGLEFGPGVVPLPRGGHELGLGSEFRSGCGSEL